MSTCCAVDDGVACSNPARWRPVLRIRAHKAHAPAEAELGLGVCVSHREQRSKPEHWVTDAGWAKIVEGLHKMGRGKPDRELTELGWQEIT